MDIQDGVGRRTVGPARTCPSTPGTEALVAELVEEFNTAPDGQALVARVLHRAVMETKSDRGVVSWIDGNEMIVAGCHDPFGEPVATGSRWPLAGEQVSAVALAAGRPEAGTIDEAAAGLAGVSAALGETYAGIKHLLVAPVSAGGEHIAILCVSRRRAEEFTAAGQRGARAHRSRRRPTTARRPARRACSPPPWPSWTNGSAAWSRWSGSRRTCSAWPRTSCAARSPSCTATSR